MHSTSPQGLGLDFLESTPNALFGCSTGAVLRAMTLVVLRGQWTYNATANAEVGTWETCVCVTANREAAYAVRLIPPGALVLLKSGGRLYQMDSH